MARPKSGDAMVPITTRVPQAVVDELELRARRAEVTPAEYHRAVMVAAMAPGTRASTPQRAPVARHPEQSRLKGKAFRGPFPKK